MGNGPKLSAQCSVPRARGWGLGREVRELARGRGQGGEPGAGKRERGAGARTWPASRARARRALGEGRRAGGRCGRRGEGGERWGKWGKWRHGRMAMWHQGVLPASGDYPAGGEMGRIWRPFSRPPRLRSPKSTLDRACQLPGRPPGVRVGVQSLNSSARNTTQESFGRDAWIPGGLEAWRPGGLEDGVRRWSGLEVGARRSSVVGAGSRRLEVGDRAGPRQRPRPRPGLLTAWSWSEAKSRSFPKSLRL
jgi:hypothetical protein